MIASALLVAFCVATSASAQAPPPAQPAPAAPKPAAPAPAAPAKAPDVPAPAETGGTPATVIDEKQIESLLGKKAESKGGDDMGQVVDVLADKSGQVRAAVIDFGGFFGVGSRKIAVDWRALRFPADAKADKVIVDLPLNELRVAPAYKDGEPVVVLGPAATTLETKPAPGPAIPAPPAAAPVTAPQASASPAVPVPPPAPAAPASPVPPTTPAIPAAPATP